MAPSAASRARTRTRTASVSDAGGGGDGDDGPNSASASPKKTSTNGDDRIRRNVACVNCRNSKVRCKASSTPGQPCQRCAKLQLSCVVDKSHKRVTKRSKIEQLEQELDNIKKAVVHPIPTTSDVTPWSLPSPRTSLCSRAQRNLGNVIEPGPPQPEVVGQIPTPGADAATSAAATISSDTPGQWRPTVTRVLGAHSVVGDDIDFYFEKYLTEFHPFLPILRKSTQNPNECYKASPILFWTVIYVACRRYAKDPHFYDTVIEHLSKEIWTAGASAVVGVEIIHALLMVCAWPFPTVRFINDPSTTLSTLAMNAATVLGFQFGKGTHPQFCIGPRADCISTDEEASSTWLWCCIIAQRTSSYSGYSLPNLHFSDFPSRKALRAPEFQELSCLYDIQKYLNQVHKAVNAAVGEFEYVSEQQVVDWDSEFELLKPAWVRHETDRIRLTLLSARLEIQAYYFFHDTTSPPSPTLRLHAHQAFHTARALITTIYDLETRTKFVSHAPNWVFRSILDASGVILSLLHSSYAPTLDDNDEGANLLAQRCYGAVMRCSVRPHDLPYRAAIIQETFWNARHLMPKLENVPQAWKHRLGAGLAYWCIHYFKVGLQEAKRVSNRVDKGLDIIRSGGSNTVISGGRYDPNNNNNNKDQGVTTAAPIEGEALEFLNEPLENVDWGQFMEEFGWGGNDPMFMGMSLP